MSRHIAQDVRKLIDGVDEKLREAVRNGSIEQEFQKERKQIVSARSYYDNQQNTYPHQDLVMKIQRNTRDDAVIQKEYQVPRYFWILTKKYREAKKGEKLGDAFWDGQREFLRTFDEGHPQKPQPANHNPPRLTRPSRHNPRQPAWLPTNKGR
jgi:hypothetical protein